MTKHTYKANYFTDDGKCHWEPYKFTNKKKAIRFINQTAIENIRIGSNCTVMVEDDNGKLIHYSLISRKC